MPALRWCGGLGVDFGKVNVRLLVRDMHRCFDFFTEKIGLVVDWGDRDTSYVSFAVAQGGEPCFALFKAELQTGYRGYVPPSGTGRIDCAVLSIPTQDVDADYRRLLDKGVVFMGEPQTIEDWYMRCVYFRDPEGNLFELCQIL